MLTAPPLVAVSKTTEVLRKCSAVGRVYVRDGESNALLSERDIKDFHFVSIETPSPMDDQSPDAPHQDDEHQGFTWSDACEVSSRA